MRQEFVANVSHELKTPLTAIRAYTETLKNGAIHDAAHNLRFLECIDEQASRLQQLIFDVISLARIESGQQTLEIKDVSLHDAVIASFESHHGAAATKQISLRVDAGLADIDILVDEELLREILDNLIDNAIKYTSPGGMIQVSWRHDNDTVLLGVADNGIGSAEADQRRIVERFYRVDRA